MIAPEVFTPKAGEYLGLYSVTKQLEEARTDAQLREVVASLWALAVSIEDGNITDVDKALRAAQDALKDALERGASDEEIKKLTENLRAALDKYLQQLAEQMRNNPQQLARPLDRNTRVMRPQDLDNMIERMERLSRSGDKDAAKQLLDQLQQMLENLQMAQPGQGEERRHAAVAERTRRHDPQAAAVARQDLQAGSGFATRPMRDNGQGDQNAMGGLQQDQQALHDRLRKLQQELAKRGMGPGQRGQQRAGRTGSATAKMVSVRPIPPWATPTDGLAKAMPTRPSMRKAGRWMRSARVPRALPKPCSKGEGEGQAEDGPGSRAGGRESGGNQTDPLGRPLHGREFGNDLTVKIPGEIDVQRVRRILEELRRRLADPSRPKIELDYIERLLKDY